MTDVDQARLDKGLAAVRRDIDGLARPRSGSPADEANRLTALVTGSLDYAAFADAEFVMEAVFEEIDVKKQVFAELEKYVAAEAVLATNTSSLSVTEMAADLEHPERVVGFHFFTPVAVMPMLEIVKAGQDRRRHPGHRFRAWPRDPEEGSGAGRRRRRLRGQPAAPAHAWARCSRRSTRAPRPDVADGALAPLGLPMSPLMLTAAVRAGRRPLHVQETLHAAFGDRFPVSENLRRIVDGGPPHPAGLGRRRVGRSLDPRDRRAAGAGRPAVDRASRCGTGR